MVEASPFTCDQVLRSMGLNHMLVYRIGRSLQKTLEI